MKIALDRTAKSIQRILLPIVDALGIVRSIQGLLRYPAFILQFVRYRSKTTEQVPIAEIYPCLFDSNSQSQSGRGHYFYQDVWALSRISEVCPDRHVDVGSRIDGFVGQLTAICPVEYVDIRPAPASIENLSVKAGSIVTLPYNDGSLHSLSSLHVIEHIGLGRYGDPIDPDGTAKAARELTRVLAVSGRLYIGTPIGRERVAFNAHRISCPLRLLQRFHGLTLIEFSVVDDDGKFKRFADPRDYCTADYACGLFIFEKSQ